MPKTKKRKTVSKVNNKSKADSSSSTESKPKLASNSKYQTIAGIVVVIAVAILGYFIFFASHASTPYVSSEAETGALVNPATKTTDSNASGGSAVQFGALPGSGGGGSGNQYCGFDPGTHPTKVMVIWEENEDSGSLLGSNMPFSKTVSSDCALATSYSANGHPSLPNYMATTSGTMSTWTGSPWQNNPGDCNAGGSCSNK